MVINQYTFRCVNFSGAEHTSVKFVETLRNKSVDGKVKRSPCNARINLGSFMDLGGTKSCSKELGAAYLSMTELNAT